MITKNDWRIDIMDGAPRLNETVVVMEQPGNKELSALDSSREHRLFTELSEKSAQGYTIIGSGITLRTDRSDETKWYSVVAWKRL